MSATWTPPTGHRYLDPALQVARRIDNEALRRLLLVYSTQPTNDGFAGDQTLLAPAFVATDRDLEELVDRLARRSRRRSAGEGSDGGGRALTSGMFEV